MRPSDIRSLIRGGFPFLLLAVGAGCAAAPPSVLPPLGHPPPAHPVRQAPGTPSAQAHHRVFSWGGTPGTLEQILEAVEPAEVLLLGEYHDDPVAHELQAELLERLADGPRPPVLSLEMFETDVQGVMDEYLQGVITEEHFLRSGRPWSNYRADYRPLVELARTRGLEVVAANPPRRYVNLVAREGAQALERLSPEALAHLPPLPVPPPTDRYRAEWDALMGVAGGGTGAAAGGHGGDQGAHADNALQAQALWDAGMAYRIAQVLASDPARLVVHLAGAFHVQNGTGIPERLAEYRPGTRFVTVVFRPAPLPLRFDPDRHQGLGDFVILTDETLPRSR